MMKLMTPAAVSELFDSLGIGLLTLNRYQPESLSLADVRRTFYYRRNRREFKYLAEKFGGFLPGEAGRDQLRHPVRNSRANSPVLLHPPPQHLPELDVRDLGGILGRGLFAAAPIAAGELIGEYTGIVRPARPGEPLPGGGYSSDYAWGFPKVRSLGSFLEIDAREAGGLLRFANHAAEPTAEPDHFALNGLWRIVFVAIRDIPAGGEITVDYSEAYWSGGERKLVE